MELRDEVCKAVEIAQKQYREAPTKEKAKLLNDFLVFLERIDYAPEKARIDALDEHVQKLIVQMSIVNANLHIREVGAKKPQIQRMA